MPCRKIKWHAGIKTCLSLIYCFATSLFTNTHRSHTAFTVLLRSFYQANNVTWVNLMYLVLKYDWWHLALNTKKQLILEAKRHFIHMGLKREWEQTFWTSNVLWVCKLSVTEHSREHYAKVNYIRLWIQHQILPLMELNSPWRVLLPGKCLLRSCCGEEEDEGTVPRSTSSPCQMYC